MRLMKLPALAVLLALPCYAYADVVTVKTSRIAVDKFTGNGFGSLDQKNGSSRFLPMPIQLAPPVPLEVELNNPDYPYGAYQRGFFLSALQLAISEAEGGDSAAQALVAHIYESGLALNRNEEEARTWYEISSQNGNPQASYRLGLYHLYGRGGLEKNTGEAVELFLKASEEGVIGAKLNLGLIYMSGEGVERDYERAEELLADVANRGIPEAQYAYGTALLDGQFGGTDEKGATKWLEKAARNGHVSAQVRYGILKFQGRGTEADESKGAFWLLKAANSGNLIAMNRLARIFLVGRGVNTDIPEAAKWHLIASRHGLSDHRLDAVMESLTDEQKEEANKRAISWLKNGTVLAP